MKAFTLELACLPPSTNRLWRAGKGRVHMADTYRTWKDAAVSTLWMQAREQSKGAGIVGPYAMRIRCVKPDRRRRDISNLIKGLEDAVVAAGIVRDDSDCQVIEAEWTREGPAVRITIIETRDRTSE